YFYEQEKGKLIEKGVYAKMARGSMVRFMAQNKIDSLEKIKDFDELGYKFSEELSSNDSLVFIRAIKK
ncbi:MAG: peroxide stress protein YaaA, partial [Bacilli bacterium]|nr:peroxide stress protein YaaA [Bacilli bacterium]